MAKKPGVSLLKNLKRRQTKPTPPKGVKLSKVKKNEANHNSGFIEEFSPEEGLEDTPVVFEAPAVQESDIESEAAQNTGIAEAVIGPPAEKRARGKRRKGFLFFGALRSAAGWVPGLFAIGRKKSKGHAAALEFAESRKRLGRKGRRNRRILVYAGSGVVIAAVVLLVLLVPGGAAAPAGGTGAVANATSSGSVSGSADRASSGTAAVVLTPTVTATSIPIPTTEPEPPDQPIDMAKLLKFYVVEADKYYKYSNNHYDYTEAELKMLAQLIWGEARGQSLDGKIAVANVVMNRVLCPGQFGSTIEQVVTAGGQFSGYKPTNPTTGCMSAARWVLDYEVWVIPQDVYYFRAVSKFSNLKGQAWNGHAYYGEISGHYFYRQSLRGRTRGGDVPPRLFERVFEYARYGCKVEDRVVRIQFMLDALGYNIEKVDGYFGEGTEDALIKFQRDHGLDDDGVAGPATVQALIEAYGPREYCAKYGRN
jgi:Cell wall hydrolyses involved in spore germination